LLLPDPLSKLEKKQTKRPAITRTTTNALGADTRYTDGRGENMNPIEKQETTETMERTREMTEMRLTLGRDDETSSEGGEVSSCQ